MYSRVPAVCRNLCCTRKFDWELEIRKENKITEQVMKSQSKLFLSIFPPVSSTSPKSYTSHHHPRHRLRSASSPKLVQVIPAVSPESEEADRNCTCISCQSYVCFLEKIRSDELLGVLWVISQPNTTCRVAAQFQFTLLRFQPHHLKRCI